MLTYQFSADFEYFQRDVLIAFRPLFSDHTALNQACTLALVLQEYSIVNQFHCFVGDNATNNDNGLIGGLNEVLDLNLSMDDRVRCAGHIINLIVKASLYGTGAAQFEKELEQAAPKEQFELYRKYGVVGKLHNFVRVVLSSNKRRELFINVQKQMTGDDAVWSFSTLNLIHDGGVRWHSIYRMLLRCRELKDPINRFIKEARRLRSNDGGDGFDPLRDSLDDDEWDEVSELVDYLEMFYEMTRRLEGNASKSGYGSLWQTVVNLQLLEEDLRQKAKAFSHLEESSYLKSCVAHAQTKLTTYWEKIVLKPSISTYCVATILHPQLRITWFKDHWRKHPSWHKKAESSMKAVFQQYLEAEDESARETALSQPSRRKLPAGVADDRWQKTMGVDLSLLTGNKGHKRARKVNELELYYDQLLEDVAAAELEKQQDSKKVPLIERPHDWWRQVGHKAYPTLFKIALDYLSIPATSCDAERAFSTAGRTITLDRNPLTAPTIEALQLQKNWLRNRVVTSSLNDLAKVIDGMAAKAEKEA